MVENIWEEKVHRRLLITSCMVGIVSAGFRKGPLLAFLYFPGGKSTVTHGDLKDWRSMPDLKGFEAAFEFLDQKTLADVPVGKHAIEGEQVYALVQKLPSRSADTAQFESHRKYIDVHYVVSGQETSGFSPAENLKLALPYDESKDVVLYVVPEQYTSVEVRPGHFVVYHPGQAHLPNCHLQGPHDLHKVVIKVHVDYLAEKRKQR
ncbi:MAG TPA: YhcH/YjgK/YiaL family protein [Terriglobia bacterium]|nr:YhcH/YjgK/YiaL family protein [Terriglobia bacterium]